MTTIKDKTVAAIDEAILWLITGYLLTACILVVL